MFFAKQINALTHHPGQINFTVVKQNSFKFELNIKVYKLFDKELKTSVNEINLKLHNFRAKSNFFLKMSRMYGQVLNMCSSFKLVGKMKIRMLQYFFYQHRS